MWQVIDRWGNQIELTGERWSYICYWHPELADHLESVLATIRHGKRRQDAFEPQKYVYFLPVDELLPDYNMVLEPISKPRSTRIPMRRGRASGCPAYGLEIGS